jgi:hypothetical protein
VLELDQYLASFNLNLRHPGAAEPVQVAWDDQAHWHPHVLRWEELDLIGRCVALTDPTLPHPGLPVLLLNRFAPVCANDDADIMFPMLESAWRSLGIFSPQEIDKHVERFDCRQGRFTWQSDASLGWSLVQDEEARESSGYDLYTLRDPGNSEFPFLAWNQMIGEMEQTCRETVHPEWLTRNNGTARALAEHMAETGELDTAQVLADALEEAGCGRATILDALRPPVEQARACWIVELLLGRSPGSVVKRCFGPTARKQRTLYRLELDIPEYTATIRLPDTACAQITDELGRALSVDNLGGASASGCSSTYSEDGQQLLERTAHISVDVWDDLEQGTQLIRGILTRNQVPEGTSIRLTVPERRAIPLYLDRNG